ncbi:methionine/alanine import family NSS transporter small subunit [Tsukamurella sp. 1534]|nr:methionine/alanine import family NSS transporter small subunit [Tsukamurella sp. 1534]
MSGGAIAMMAVSIVVVWGGLVAAVVNFRRHPELDGDD